jgi:F0F1-type ATP synthase membrane subunit b/b'
LIRIKAGPESDGMLIDWWTLGLQSVNVAVLVWLLGRYFWRPVASMIEQRRAAAQQAFADAQAKRSEAAAALAEIEKARAGLAREREAILAVARESAEQARAAILADAAKEAAALGGAATAAVAKNGKRPPRSGPSGQAGSRSKSPSVWLSASTAPRCGRPFWNGS